MRELTKEEIISIAGHFMDVYAMSACDEEGIPGNMVGYSCMLNLGSLVTEIVNDCETYISVRVFNESFSDLETNPHELCGYIKRKMEEVLPNALATTKRCNDNVIEIMFVWR